MTIDREQLAKAEEAILVAYLDGELSEQGRRSVEERLAAEPALRDTLAQLEENWRLLDLLEQEETDKELVATTMSLLALTAEDTRSETPLLNRLGKAMPMGMLLLFLFGIAFLCGSHAGDEYSRLRKAAPVIERLDMYLPLLEEHSEFLHLLTERGLFLPGKNFAWPPDTMPNVFSGYSSPSAFAARMQQLENFDESLYSRFYDNYQKFKAFSPEKQRRLLDLHHGIAKSPKSYEQLLTLQNFHHWRKALQSYEKDELRKPMSAQERVEQIAELKHRLDTLRVGAVVTPRIATPEENEGERLAQKLEKLPVLEKDRLLAMPPERILQILNELPDEQ